MEGPGFLYDVDLPHYTVGCYLLSLSIKLEKVTKRELSTPLEAWNHSFRLFNNIFIYFCAFCVES